MQNGPLAGGPVENARLSAVADELLVRRDGVGRREEPPRYESGFRAHGSKQRFRRLLRHAVARALTTAPSLTGVGPAAEIIFIPHGWRRNEPPGTLFHKADAPEIVCGLSPMVRGPASPGSSA